jgi:hypothetical protein
VGFNYFRESREPYFEIPVSEPVSHSLHSRHFETTMHMSPIMMLTKNGSMIHGIIASYLSLLIHYYAVIKPGPSY